MLTESEIFNEIKKQWCSWVRKIKFSDNTKWVVGISGGKDSTVVAALAVKIFGCENVIGVTMPCDGQKDFDDSLKVINHLNIKHVNIDIGNAVSSILNGVENNTINVSYDTKTNLPARIRMSTLFAVAQSVNGIVLNTCNLTEDILGYNTLFGDDSGSFAPIKRLTVTEVIKLGDWLGIPYELTHKTPVDGLQPLSDEEKLGMKYSDVDEFIRTGKYKGNTELRDKIMNMFKKNRFKTLIVDLPCPEFNMPNHVERTYNFNLVAVSNWK